MVSFYKIYVNTVLQNLPVIDLVVKENIKSYTPQSTIKIINPNGIYNTNFSLNDTVKIELYDKTDETYYKKIEGYITNISRTDTDGELELQINGWGGRLYERRVKEVYNYWEVTRIVKDIANNKLDEFTTTNVTDTGTEYLMNEQNSQDGTVSLSSTNDKYAQSFTPTQSNMIKCSIYVNSSSDGIADVQLREGDGGGNPSVYKLLRQVSNVSLTAGWNDVYVTYKGLNTSTTYWLVIVYKSGTFTIDSNGSGSSGRVSKSTTADESWSTQTQDDLRFRTYYTDGVILELVRFAGKTVNECLKDLVDALPGTWIYYIDNDSDLHFEEEEFVTSGYELNSSNLFNVDTEVEGQTIYNDITVNGGESLTQNFDDQFNGDGTTKTFVFSPGRTVDSPLKRVTVGGTLKVEGTDFTVDYEGKTITFVTAPGNGVTVSVIHDYRNPVIAHTQDDDSIAQYGLREFIKDDKNIVSNERAREIAQSLLNLYTNEYNTISATEFFNPSNNVASYVHITNTRLGLDDDYLITEIEHSVNSGGLETVYRLSAEQLVTVPDILKQIKSELSDIRLARANLDAPVVDIKDFYSEINFETVISGTERDVSDSFILGHPGDNGKLGYGKVLYNWDDTTNWSSTEFTLSSSDTQTIVDFDSLQFISATAQTGYITGTNSYGDLSDYTGVNNGTPTQGTCGLWIYLSATDDVDYVKLRLGSSSSDYTECTATFKAGHVTTGWNYLTFDLDSADVTTGTPDWTATDYTRIEIKVDNSSVTNYLAYLTISQSNNIGLNGLGYRYVQKTIVS